MDGWMDEWMGLSDCLFFIILRWILDKQYFSSFMDCILHRVGFFGHSELP